MHVKVSNSNDVGNWISFCVIVGKFYKVEVKRFNSSWNRILYNSEAEVSFQLNLEAYNHCLLLPTAPPGNETPLFISVAKQERKACTVCIKSGPGPVSWGHPGTFKLQYLVNDWLGSLKYHRGTWQRVMAGESFLYCLYIQFFLTQIK